MYAKTSNYVGDMIQIERAPQILMCESSGGHTDYPEFHTNTYDVYNEYSEYDDYSNYSDCSFDPCNGGRS